MKKVEKLKAPITGYKNFYPLEIQKHLKTIFGCDGQNANFIIEGEYPKQLIETIAQYLSNYHGKLNEYKIWYCKPIKSWRLVFGK